jgi:hypothetical protein
MRMAMTIYRVHHPIVSSCRTTDGRASIVYIPVGGAVEISEKPQRGGLVDVFWEGRRLRIFSMDLFEFANELTPEVPVSCLNNTARQAFSVLYSSWSQ